MVRLVRGKRGTEVTTKGVTGVSASRGGRTLTLVTGRLVTRGRFVLTRGRGSLTTKGGGEVGRSLLSQLQLGRTHLRSVTSTLVRLARLSSPIKRILSS